MLLGTLVAALITYAVQMTTLGLVKIGFAEPARSVPGLVLSGVPEEIGSPRSASCSVAWQTDPWLLIAGTSVVLHLQQSLMHRQLREAVENEAKTGLLSADTWREKAERELSTARTRPTHGRPAAAPATRPRARGTPAAAGRASRRRPRA